MMRSPFDRISILCGSTPLLQVLPAGSYLQRRNFNKIPFDKLPII